MGAPSDDEPGTLPAAEDEAAAEAAAAAFRAALLFEICLAITSCRSAVDSQLAHVQNRHSQNGGWFFFGFFLPWLVHREQSGVRRDTDAEPPGVPAPLLLFPPPVAAEDGDDAFDDDDGDMTESLDEPSWSEIGESDDAVGAFEPQGFGSHFDCIPDCGRVGQTQIKQLTPFFSFSLQNPSGKQG